MKTIITYIIETTDLLEIKEIDSICTRKGLKAKFEKRAVDDEDFKKWEESWKPGLMERLAKK